jgi:hypothetical protein
MEIVERWSSIYIVLVQVKYKVSNENQSLVKISDVLPGHAIHFRSWQPGDTNQLKYIKIYHCQVKAYQFP